MARIIWNQPANLRNTSAIGSASSTGSSEGRFMKLRPRAIFVLRIASSFDDGTITDEHGEHLGNIYDEL
jgi:hypothetical protein